MSMTEKVKPSLDGLKQILSQETGVRVADITDDLAPTILQLSRISDMCGRRFGQQLDEGAGPRNVGDIRRELGV